MERPGPRVVSCPQCRRYYRLPPNAALKPGAKLRCTKCGNLFSLAPRETAPSPATDGPRILVASDGSEMRSIIEEILHQAGYIPRLAGAGEEAWQAIEEWAPQATVLDVALPGIPVFEICDRIRKHRTYSSLGVILLASVYQRTRYKRAPTSLYGADDYIEKHHLRDSLVPKIERLLPPRRESESPPPPAEREEARPDKEGLLDPEETQKEQEVIVREERFGPAAAAAGKSDPQQESLRRFARIIVSDIALYNEELIEEGVRKGNLRQLLAAEIAEGQKLFRTRAPTGGGMEIYDQTLEDFIAKQRARFAGPAGSGEQV